MLFPPDTVIRPDDLTNGPKLEWFLRCPVCRRENYISSDALCGKTVIFCSRPKCPFQFLGDLRDLFSGEIAG